MGRESGAERDGLLPLLAGEVDARTSRVGLVRSLPREAAEQGAREGLRPRRCIETLGFGTEVWSCEL